MSKVSRYNHFQRWNNDFYIAFNARTGAVALMTAENYQTYLELIGGSRSNENGSRLTASEQELLKQLEYGKFMTADECDELADLKFQHELTRYDKTKLCLVLAPTLACNMACPYCYEMNKRGKMSAEVLDAMLNLVNEQAVNLNQLDVNWYGGEPLLTMDVIEDMSQKFLALGKEYKFAYTSSVITNGYLMTREVVDRLAKLNVKMCQVTLDGPERLHNQKRPLKNGKESFATIVQNLDYASTKIPIALRVNIDNTMTSADIQELLGELAQAGLKGRVAIGFGQLEPASSACVAIAETCYENADFSKVEIDYYRLLLDNGFRIENLPMPSTTFCMANRVNSFLIDPEGYLYRCLNHAGDIEKAMGNIREEINFQHPNFMRLFAFDPFEDRACTECSILPICMGGCPSQRFDRELVGEQLCRTWKHNLTPMLEIIAKSRQQKAQSSPKEQT